MAHDIVKRSELSPVRQSAASKAETTKKVSLEMINDEAAERLAKTERLRKARLEQEAQRR